MVQVVFTNRVVFRRFRGKYVAPRAGYSNIEKERIRIYLPGIEWIALHTNVDPWEGVIHALNRVLLAEVACVFANKYTPPGTEWPCSCDGGRFCGADRTIVKMLETHPPSF